VPAQWRSQTSELSERLEAAVTGVLHTMAQPAHLRRLRMVLLSLLAVWIVLALTGLLWALVPVAEPAVGAPPKLINPVSVGRSSGAAAPVDIDRMVAWHLFGEVGATAPLVAEPDTTAQANARAGIEDGAQQTQLQLKLAGIVASTEDGLGHAIIEYQNQQAVYAVEDKLPVPGQVKLAKVMPQQVVLDNGGTYELLVLFDKSSLSSSMPATPAPTVTPPAASVEVDKRTDSATTSLAQSYRERLYQNPQSLAEVVNVSAVREGAALLGYRLSPGNDQQQFAQLGFQAGDVVTSVNGVSLDNPANTMVLYNSLREAGEVVFELQREGQPLNLSVNLDSSAAQ
jgi:general secretion pathway protein C